MIKSRNKVTAYNIASTIILQGLAFFSGPIFSNALGTNNYGIASVYLTWVTLASTVFSLQAGGAIAIARVSYKEKEQNKYQSSVLSLASISFVIFSIATVLIIAVVNNRIKIDLKMVLLGLVHAWGMYCVSFANSKFSYEFSADKNFKLSVITSASTILLSLLLIHLFPKNENYWGRIIGQSIIYGILGLVIYGTILYRGKTIVNREYWKFTLPITIPTVFHLLAGTVLNQSDKVMLQMMVDNSTVGIYALACTFGNVLQTIWGALNNSWVPFYYEYTKNDEFDKIRIHSRNYIELFSVLTMGFILLSREVFHLYSNTDFWNGAELIPIFAIGIYFVFLYSFPVNFEFYHKKTKMIAIGTTLAAICNIVLNYVMIMLLGIRGAVVATAVSHGLQFVFHFLYARKIDVEKFPYKFRDFIPGFIAVFGTCIISMITDKIWFIRWGIGLGLGIYIVLKIVKRREIF